jgi:dihydroflavonol-4-reductase
MKALVTGGHSFVGSALIEELDTLGFDVLALLDQDSGHQNLKGLKFQSLDGSRMDFSLLCRAVQDVSYVFHLEEPGREKTLHSFHELNHQATERLARAIVMSHSKVTRFVYLSSLAAAGPASSLKPKVESEVAVPVSAYGQSKLAAEKNLLRYRDIFPVSIVRPSVVYGPRDRTLLWLSQVLARNFMPVFAGSTQGGHKYFSAIHVRDLCRGLVQVAVSPLDKVPSGEIFYLSGDGVHTYQEFTRLIADCLDCDPLKVRIPKLALQTVTSCLSALNLVAKKNRSFGLKILGNWSHWGTSVKLDKMNEILFDYWICSNQKAKKMFGFSPEFDLASGVAHAIDWYKKQGWI